MFSFKFVDQLTIIRIISTHHLIGAQKSVSLQTTNNSSKLMNVLFEFKTYESTFDSKFYFHFI